MTNAAYSDKRKALATIIAEALGIADQLKLDMVGISLSGALESLADCRITPDASSAVH